MADDRCGPARGMPAAAAAAAATASGLILLRRSAFIRWLPLVRLKGAEAAMQVYRRIRSGNFKSPGELEQVWCAETQWVHENHNPGPRSCQPYMSDITGRRT